MKKSVVLILSAVLILTSLTSCASIFDKNPEVGTAQSGSPTHENDVPNEMNMESYMQYFVSYFHEPYRRGDDISKTNLLYPGFLFCYANRDKLDFVKTDEEKQLIMIPGKELERVIKNLIPYSGDLSEYRSSMDNTSDSYSAETDTYVVNYARDYWNEDPYYLDYDEKIKKYDENGKIKKPQITQTESELTVIAEIYHGPDLEIHENVRKMEYKFEKVIDNGFLFYRLTSIKELS